MVAVAPAFRLTRVQATTLPEVEQTHCVGLALAEIRLRFAGSMLVKATPVAVLGPLLVTMKVKEDCPRG